MRILAPAEISVRQDENNTIEINDKALILLIVFATTIPQQR